VTGVSAKLQRIAVGHQSEHRFLWRSICRELKQRFNSEIHVYCVLNQQLSFYEPDLRDGLIDSVQCVNYLRELKAISDPDDQAVYARANKYEELLGTTYNRLMMASRYYGRAYSLGGFYHPRSHQSKALDYCAIVDRYNRQLDFWQREFDAKKFTLVVSPPLELDYLAESRGVEFRSFMEAGLNNLYYWTNDRFGGSRELELAYENTVADQPADILGTYGSNEEIMAKIDDNVRLTSLAKSMILATVRQGYWYFRGYDKARSYFLSERFMSAYRVNKQMREVKRLATTRLNDIEGQRFVFYPLHEEPESVLMVGSPERFDQLGAIASIARDLPAGVKLVVKETYFGVGRRPDNFYRQIVDFKNVVFMDMAERGIEVARHADAIVTICGTVGQEGAILGRPVIQLARRTPYACVPHVRVCHREEEQKPLLTWALSKSFDRRRALLDGARFSKALATISVDLDGYNYLKPEIIPETIPSQVVDGLVRSVGFDVLDGSGAARTAAAG
jgi:hypothetical protein